MKILFIGGSGRSGTTLLDLILGQFHGIFNVGELRHIWERGIINNELCGCKRELTKCETWKSILYHAFPDLDSIKHDIHKLSKEVDKPKYLPKLILKYDPSFNERRSEYEEILRRLYSSIFEITGAKVIVDSSKTPSYGFLLSNLQNSFDVRFLHMIRNPQAVAYSWKKKKIRPEIRNRTELMPRYSITKSSIWWSGSNLFSELLKLYLKKNYTLKYENFTADPQMHIVDILRFLDINDFGLEHVFNGPNEITIRPTHTVAGNPNRFFTGRMLIKTDDEWKTKLPAWEKLVVKALTFPLAQKYGY